MFTKKEHLLTAWKEAAKSTKKIFAALTDQSLSQQVAPGFFTLGGLAWHLTKTLPEMMEKTGLSVTGPKEKTPMPSSAQTILETYDKAAQSLYDQISQAWNDESLMVEDDMYGSKWTRAFTFRGLIDHQTHHVGQMTVLMRQARLKVPGIYGPAKEEWEQYGMKDPNLLES